MSFDFDIDDAVVEFIGDITDGGGVSNILYGNIVEFVGSSVLRVCSRGNAGREGENANGVGSPVNERDVIICIEVKSSIGERSIEPVKIESDDEVGDSGVGIDGENILNGA